MQIKCQQMRLHKFNKGSHIFTENVVLLTLVVNYSIKTAGLQSQTAIKMKTVAETPG